MIESDPHAELIAKLHADRVLAHRFLFEHRHPVDSAECHADIIRVWHDTTVKRVVTEGFRELGKSTVAEEVVAVRACFREFRNCVILGASEPRAMERLESIKHELDTNETITDLFGPQRGAIWQGHKILLASGAMIQAYGRGQSLRGVKYHDVRPDFWVIDDFEDEDTVASQASIDKGLRYLYRTFLPAMAKDSLGRFLGNRLHPKAVIVQLARDPDWTHQRFPIEHIGPDGERVATWPAQFPLAWIDTKRAAYARQGLLTEFNQEYMCEAEASEEKNFRRDMIKVRPRVRTWEPVWCMLDPQRKSGRSATAIGMHRHSLTGFAAWSYLGSRIVVWRCWERSLLPDQLIDELFKIDAEFSPVCIGVEETGLWEWLGQAVRAEMLKRGRQLPFRPVPAPQALGSKADFVRAMQPYFTAGEIEFAEDMPEMFAHLLDAPARIGDDVNALAYFTKLRPGLAIYDDWTPQCVVDDIQVSDRPLFLALNATRAYTAAVLCQHDGRLAIIADWLEEGDPGQVVAKILADARLVTGRAPKCVVPPLEFDRFQSVGLLAALTRLGVDVLAGTSGDAGRAEIRALLRSQIRGMPGLLVTPRARWTLNALAGGYAREAGKTGLLAEQPTEGAYKILMEGLEAFAGLLTTGAGDDDDQAINYRTARNGQRYRSAYVERREPPGGQTNRTG